MPNHNNDLRERYISTKWGCFQCPSWSLSSSSSSSYQLLRWEFFFSSLFLLQREVPSLSRAFTVQCTVYTGMVLNGLDGENAGLGIASSVFWANRSWSLFKMSDFERKNEEPMSKCPTLKNCFCCCLSCKTGVYGLSSDTWCKFLFRGMGPIHISYLVTPTVYDIYANICFIFIIRRRMGPTEFLSSTCHSYCICSSTLLPGKDPIAYWQRKEYFTKSTTNFDTS